MLGGGHVRQREEQSHGGFDGEARQQREASRCVGGEDDNDYLFDVGEEEPWQQANFNNNN